MFTLDKRWFEQFGGNKSDLWDTVKVWDFVKDRVFKLLPPEKLNREDNLEIKSIISELVLLWYMFDKIFNHIPENNWDLNIDNWVFSLEEKINELSYYGLPIVGVFQNWQPIFLNWNYVKALWSKNVNEVRENIEKRIALATYYEPNSAREAHSRLSWLKVWQWYKWLKLVTKEWKTIIWNSFPISNWFEVRIWTDVTHNNWELLLPLDDKNINDWLSLDVSSIINETSNSITKILPMSDLKFLDYLKVLLESFETIWKNWQFLMNSTNTLNKTDMFYNPRYLQSTWLTTTEIDEKLRDWTLWPDLYSPETMLLINARLSELKSNWHYFDTFPMIDQKTKKWVDYAWARFLISIKELWVERSIWIWSPTKSKAEFELDKWFRENM